MFGYWRPEPQQRVPGLLLALARRAAARIVHAHVRVMPYSTFQGMMAVNPGRVLVLPLAENVSPAIWNTAFVLQQQDERTISLRFVLR